MGDDIFLPIYFFGLYSPEEQDKINLWSSDFYYDLLDFYCKKENERVKLIQGVAYLTNRIAILDDLTYVMIAWDKAIMRINIKEIFANIVAKKLAKPNLVTEFKTRLGEIFEAKKEELEKRRGKRLERITSERDKIAEELIREKSINDKLLKIEDYRAGRKLEDIGNIPDFKDVLLRIKFDSKEVKRKRIAVILNEVYNLKLHETLNDKDFTALAAILYKTGRDGWIINTPTFINWLRLLAKTFERKVPTYKEKRVSGNVEIIKIKYPFLDHLL